MLTADELTVLIEAIAGQPPPPPVVEMLRRRLEADPDALTSIVRCLAAEGRTAICHLERLANDPVEAPGAVNTRTSVFCRVGDYWRVTYEGRTVLLHDAKGLGYLAWLLAHPGKRIRVEELIWRTGGGARDAEGARTSVTKAIKAVILRLVEVHPALAEHLAATVRRGRFCRYLPEAGAPNSMRCIRKG